MQVSSHMPDDLEEQDAEGLLRTLLGVCNESSLSRVEILGALEGAKLWLASQWLGPDGEGDEE